jgi:hypothetical protein
MEHISGLWCRRHSCLIRLPGRVTIVGSPSSGPTPHGDSRRLISGSSGRTAWGSTSSRVPNEGGGIRRLRPRLVHPTASGSRSSATRTRPRPVLTASPGRRRFGSPVPTVGTLVSSSGAPDTLRGRPTETGSCSRATAKGISPGSAVGGTPSLYKIHPDGTGMRRITRNPRGDEPPAW